MNAYWVKLGLREKEANKITISEGQYVGRVVSQYKDLYKVLCEKGELLAEVAGRFRHQAECVADFPAVGDFVMIDREENDGGNAIIYAVLPRRSAFVRKAAGGGDGQIVASNIDTIFICMSLNNDFNLRRLERYLAVGWDSGAVPVVVLTKADLCNDLEEKQQAVEMTAPGVDIIITSAVDEQSYMPLSTYIAEGKTVAFIGSSGVGKSTLINCLLGEGKQETKGLRNDDKGRHTTTRRELILLDDGGMVIDTPGMRELGLQSADIDSAFADVEELAAMCKFRDCGHSGEPGCAVQEAIEAGRLSAERVASYHKLKKEAKYEGLTSRQIEEVKLEEMFSSVGGMKNARKFLKEKDKRR